LAGGRAFRTALERLFVGAGIAVGDTDGGSGETCTSAAAGTSSGRDSIAGGALLTCGILGGGQFLSLTSPPA
jgi:hypothetical protein